MVILRVNQRTLSLFGYDAATELVGSSVKILMPASFARAHDGFVSRYVKTREPRVVGSSVGRQVTGKRRDGSLVALVLTIDEYGHDTFVAAFQDVTENERLRLDRDRVASIAQQKELRHEIFDHRFGNYVFQARELLEAGNVSRTKLILEDMHASILIARGLERSLDAEAATVDASAYFRSLFGNDVELVPPSTFAGDVAFVRAVTREVIHAAVMKHAFFADVASNAWKHGAVDVPVRVEARDTSLAVSNAVRPHARARAPSTGIGFRSMQAEAEARGLSVRHEASPEHFTLILDGVYLGASGPGTPAGADAKQGATVVEDEAVQQQRARLQRFCYVVLEDMAPVMKLIVAAMQRRGIKRVLELQEPWHVSTMIPLVAGFAKTNSKPIIFIMDENITDVDGDVTGSEIRDRLDADPATRALIEAKKLILVSHSASELADDRVAYKIYKQVPLIAQLDHLVSALINSAAPPPTADS